MVYVFIGFIGLWILLTSMMFFAARIHNKSTNIGILKAKWEPYAFGGGLAMMLIGLLGLVT